MIKRSEFFKLFEEEIKKQFEDGRYKKKALYKSFEGGGLRIKFRALNSFNFDREQVSWEIETYYVIRFDIIEMFIQSIDKNPSKLEEYSTKVSSDEVKLRIDVDDPSPKQKSIEMVESIRGDVVNFYCKYNDLEEIFKWYDSKVDSLDIHLVKYLTIAWVVDKENFNTYIEKANKRRDALYDSQEPFLLNYNRTFEEIIAEIKAYDFGSHKTCLSFEFDGKSYNCEKNFNQSQD